MSGLYNHTTKFKAITTTDMKSDEEESSLENNSEFGLDQIGSNLSKMDQNGSNMIKLDLKHAENYAKAR